MKTTLVAGLRSKWGVTEEHLIETGFLDHILLDQITSNASPTSPVLRNRRMELLMAGNREDKSSF